MGLVVKPADPLDTDMGGIVRARLRQSMLKPVQKIFQAPCMSASIVLLPR